MIMLPKELYAVILRASLDGRPEEVCGLIGGTEENGVRTVKKVYVLENMDHSDKHFSINPVEQLNAVRDMRKNGLVPLGCFHSHPASPSFPSEEDKRLAYDSNASYIIISLMEDKKPVLRSFRIVDNVSTQEPVKYIGG